ncbi:ABC transporter permease subunit [Thiorhodococcus mannitoliphagus]|uniref:ABC transporter permease subunit n=1 Tax=Thiorhodococcus mannitoliphagus TaxID=329406 RepID=A0A6P1DSY4_9GAMM|nr:Gldg family protein [Thiorhodococcus mannitoliphagus]NEX20313.1 ABC transporter permease subunit [Thiorhodococcus mannitoliphagus]
MGEVTRVARRELAAFFGSPVAYIFIGTFLAVCLFVFFWVDAFFSRNIADARPLFEWMPVLLIFLCAALSMRLWSEERRAGTLETLLTLPVATPKLVLGKFLAALGLVAIALALTLPLPITVSLLGPLDWGPVIGAYLATLLLAAAYLSIGLFISSRTDNPIVALIGSALVCGVFYLLGSPALTSLVGHSGGEILRLIGSGSRFESITRGVIDLRDLYYYLSIVGAFLALTVYSLERLRWAEHAASPRRHHRWTLITGLTVANLIAANLWMQGVTNVRTDLTEGNLYTISDATRNYLGQLQEPLLIRGYFSAETHPLLAPLVPQLRDLLEEYQIAGKGKVRVEIVDPQQSPELEREAGEQYGIRPVAFQTASKYQSAVVNSYFDILVKYGDQFETLGFQDLIDVKVRSETDLDVRLRNPEYDLTRTIKKVLYGYQGGGDVFTNISKPLQLKGYISPADQLPEPLPALRADLESVLSELQAQAPDTFSFEIQDPGAGDGSLAKTIQEEYGFEPLVISLLDPTPFYFYMVLEGDDQRIPIPLPEALDRAGLSRAIEAGIKRFAPGVMRTVALYTPTPAPTNPYMGGPQGGDYGLLQQSLQESFSLRDTDLSSGQVPEEADLLMVVGPEALDEKQQFAIDQFLMQGGTVILAASSFNIDLGGGSISARKAPTGLEDWLDHQGIRLEPSLVLDPQNTPFPIPVQRDVGGFVVQEIQTLDYPYFPDVRSDGLAEDNGMTSNLGQITMNWSSPITIDAEKNASRAITKLIRSSASAWTSDSAEMQPDFEAHGGLGFPVGDDEGRKLLAVAVEGRFQSPFAGKPSPLLPDASVAPADEAEDADTADPTATADEPETAQAPVISGVVESSPESARLILIGSSSFLTDTAISLANEATQTRYLKPIELVQNAVEWSLEDRGLLALRGRGQFSRMLEPVGQQTRLFWESLNYVLALAGLALVYLLYRQSRARRERAYADILGNGGTQS